MADFPPQNVANLLGAFPKLGFTPPQSFWDKALPAMQRALPAFKPQVGAWSACGSIHGAYIHTYIHGDMQRADSCMPRTHHRPRRTRSQEMSTVTNALAKLEVDPGPAFVAALGKEAAARMGDFRPQDLTVALVSMARLGHDPTPAFLPAVIAAAHQLLPLCNAQVTTDRQSGSQTDKASKPLPPLRSVATTRHTPSLMHASILRFLLLGPVPPHHGPGAVGGAALQGLPGRLHGAHPPVPPRLSTPGRSVNKRGHETHTHVLS